METNRGIIYIHQRHLSASQSLDGKILIPNKQWVHSNKVYYYDANFLSYSFKINIYFQVNNDDVKSDMAQGFIREFIENFKVDYCK